MIPYSQQAYTQGTGTTQTPQFLFETRDPGIYDIKYPLYSSWVNTSTHGIWFLEQFASSSGVVTALWRAVGPVVLSTTDPTSSDYLYPLGQTWVNTSANAYWALVSLSCSTATLEQLSVGSMNVESLEGNSGGAVGPNASNVINVVGDGTTVNVVGDPSTNTLTISSIGGSNISEIAVDYHTGPGTNPVLPTSGGEVTIVGAQVANSAEAKPVYTASLAANTLNVSVQKAAAFASTQTAG